jgi:hypothetical protein
VEFVAVVGEASEAGAVEVDGEGVVGGDEHVEAEVELLVADEEGVVDVALHDVGLGLVGGIRPVADVPYAPEQEDPLPLAPPDLHRSSLTGFIIQTLFCSLHLLNSSRKIGYSLGRL